MMKVPKVQKKWNPSDKMLFKTKYMWTIDQIKKHGFEVIDNNKLWCHFRGHGFDVFINLDTKQVKGNLFNFHSYKSNFKGNFRAALSNDEEMKFLLRVIQ